MKERFWKKVKNTFAMVTLTLLTMCALPAVQVSAADDDWYMDYTYTLDDSAGTIRLLTYNGDGGDIILPKTAVIGGRTYRTTFMSAFSAHLFAYHDTITGITFESGFVFPEDCSGLFMHCLNLSNITFPADVDTSNVRGMRAMFSDCSALASVDVSMFDTGNVEDFHGMFFNCELMTAIDVGNFDTRRATDMGYMFGCCSKLETLDLSNFETSHVENMESMFSNCSVLRSVNVSGFNTSSVTTMKSMFAYCYALEHVDVSGFDTGSVKTMQEMFMENRSLQELDISGFDTSHVENFYNTFANLPVDGLDLGSFDTSAAKDMGYMFANLRNMEKLDLSGFDMSHVTSSYSMFLGCSSLTEIITPKAVSDVSIGFYDSKKFARKDANGYYIEPLYAELGEAPPQTTIYRYDTYTVRFNANGGEGSMADQKIQCGMPVALTPNQFTREGYTFDGWALSYTWSSQIYADEERVTDLTKKDWTANLYARWKRNLSFTVSVPATIYMFEKPGKTYPGGDLEGTMVYTVEYAGEAGDYISITATTPGIAMAGGETIPVTVTDQSGKWTTKTSGVVKDKETGVYTGSGSITILANKDVSDIEPGSYRGTLVLNISSGTE